MALNLTQTMTLLNAAQRPVWPCRSLSMTLCCRTRGSERTIFLVSSYHGVTTIIPGRINNSKSQCQIETIAPFIVPFHDTLQTQQQQMPPSQYARDQSAFSRKGDRVEYHATKQLSQSLRSCKLDWQYGSATTAVRSTSSTSYVALMRKQKATVWCDRAQVEDPRIIDAQRAAKVQAVMEIAGGLHHDGRMSTSSNNVRFSVGIRSKIRLHSVPKASTYTALANLHGAGVPMRLSASELDEENSDKAEDSKYINYHRRNGIGRSSIGSGPRTNSCSNSGRVCSNYSTPQGRHSPVSSMDDVAGDGETLVPNGYNRQARDFFSKSGSSGSNDAAEPEKSSGGIGGLPQAKGGNELERKTREELSRRISVDNRAMATEGDPLYVANPDLSD